MAGQRDVGGKGIVELPVRIRRKTDGGQKVLQLLHFVGRQRGGRRLQVGKRGVEFFQTIPVAAPVKRFVANDVLQGLCHHRPFHRMKMVRHGRRKPPEVVVRRGEEFHAASWIAQVPGQTVKARVHMAGSAGCLAETGGFVRVVKVFAPGFHRARSGIVHRHIGHHHLSLRINHGQRGGKPVQHVEPLARFIQRQAGRPIPQQQRRLTADSIAGHVDDEQVARAHACHVTAGPVRTPHDPARVAEGFFPFGHGHGVRGVIQMRVEVLHDRPAILRVDQRQVHPREYPFEHRLVAQVVQRLGPHQGQFTRRRIHGQVHANVHQAAEVTHRPRRRVDDRHVVVHQIPSPGSAGENGIGSTNVLGPIAAVVVEPPARVVLFDD